MKTEQQLKEEIKSLKTQLTNREKEFEEFELKSLPEVKDCKSIRLFTNGTKKELTKKCIEAGYCPLVFVNDYILDGNDNYYDGCVVGVKE